jgi:hypothetical protein
MGSGRKSSSKGISAAELAHPFSPGLSRFFERHQKIQNSNHKKIGLPDVDERQKRSGEKRKRDRLRKHRAGVYSLVPTQLKSIEIDVAVEKSAVVTPIVVTSKSSDYLNEQLLELNALLLKGPTTKITPNNKKKNDGYFDVHAVLPWAVASDSELECHELYIRLISYCITCMASDIRPVPHPDDKCFQNVMFNQPVFVRDLENHYKMSGSYLSALGESLCEIEGRCDVRTCSLVNFKSGSKFWSQWAKKWVACTSNAYLCCESGKIHLCDVKSCPWLQMVEQGVGWKCPASERMQEDIIICAGSKLSNQNYQSVMLASQYAGQMLSLQKTRMEYDPGYAKRKMAHNRSRDKKDKLSRNCWDFEDSSSSSSSNGAAKSMFSSTEAVSSDLIEMVYALQNADNEGQRKTIADLTSQIQSIKSVNDDEIKEEIPEDLLGKKFTALSSVVEPGLLFVVIKSKIEKAFSAHCIQSYSFPDKLRVHMALVQQHYQSADISSETWISQKNTLRKQTLFNPFCMDVDITNNKKFTDRLFGLHNAIIFALAFRLVVILILSPTRFPSLYNKRTAVGADKQIKVHEISILTSQVVIMLNRLVQHRSSFNASYNSIYNDAHHRVMSLSFASESHGEIINLINRAIPSHFFICLLTAMELKSEPSTHTLVRTEKLLDDYWGRSIPSMVTCQQLVANYGFLFK